MNFIFTAIIIALFLVSWNMGYKQAQQKLEKKAKCEQVYPRD